MSRVSSRKGVIYGKKPYPHLVMALIFDADLRSDLFNAVSRFDWVEDIGEFYNFYLPCKTSHYDEIFNIINKSGFLDLYRQILEKQFLVRLESFVLIEVQKFVTGTGIGFHTDGMMHEVRLVINLIDSWSSDEGGIWILSDHPGFAGAKYIPAMDNTGFAFQTKDDSFHSRSSIVKMQHNRSEYCIVVRYPVRM